MALIFLPDVCDPFNKVPSGNGKGKAPAEVAKPLQVTKSSSAASLSSACSSFSKASDQSTGSSMCSFAPIKASVAEPGERVRIAICGAW